MLYLVLIALILITPVRLTLRILLGENVQGRLDLNVWNIRSLFTFRVIKNDGKHQLVWGRSGGRQAAAVPPPEQIERLKTLLKTFLRSDHGRRFLLHHVSVTQVLFSLRLGGENAARIALWSGFLKSLMQAVPASWRKVMKGQITPDFLHTRSNFQGQCIIFFHLGTILISSLLFMLAHLKQMLLQRRKNRKEEIDHGTSHW